MVILIGIAEPVPHRHNLTMSPHVLVSAGVHDSQVKQTGFLFLHLNLIACARLQSVDIAEVSVFGVVMEKGVF